MRLSGVEIQIKDFSKSLRGYDIKEVRDFLDQVARQFEQLAYENKSMKDKVREKELTILGFSDEKTMLKNTMVTAKKVTDDIKQDATKEATQIMTQAKLKADALLKQAQQNLKVAIDEVKRVKKQKQELSFQIRTTLEAHLKLLDQLEQEDTSADINIPRQR